MASAKEPSEKEGPKSAKSVGVKPPAPIKPVDTSLRLSDTAGAEQRANAEGASEGPSLLAPELRDSGDPVDGNPFSIDSPRHLVWRDATLNAEQQWCRLVADFIRRRPRQEGLDWLRADSLAKFEAWCLDLCAAKYDIWAMRAVHVVWTDADLRAYDHWLFNWAQAWLDAEQRAGRQDILPAIKARLIERMHWWKAEARRYLAEVKNDLTSRADIWTKLERRGDLIVVAKLSANIRTEMKRDYKLLYRDVRKLNLWVSQKRANGTLPTLEETKQVFVGTILVGDVNRVPYLTDRELQELIDCSQTPSTFAERIVATRWGFTQATAKTYLRRKPRSKRLDD